MNEKSNSVEDKIILATIECIEKYGLSGATNRQISQMAGVNNAAINYYFRSKEVLLQRCMEITLKNAFDLSEMPSMPELTAAQRCGAILLELIQGGLNYPGITRAHFYPLLTEGQDDRLLEASINQFIEDLALDLQARGSRLAGAGLRQALVQIVSAVSMAILAPRLFARQQGIDLQDAAQREIYVTRLVSRLLEE